MGFFTRRLLALLSFCVFCAFRAPASAAVASLFPPAGSTVPADAPLRLVFETTPAFHARGKLSVVDAATDQAVYTLDLSTVKANASPWPFQAMVGKTSLNVRPLILSGKEAYFALPPSVLKAGSAYYVRLDSGAFSESAGGVHAGYKDRNAWRFTAKAAPAKARSAYAVAADGSGDFCTVQGALDFIPAGNTAPVTLRIAAGVYPEILRSEGKHAITLQGADRARCEIRYENNNNFNSGTAGRALARIYGNDIVIRNLTFRNATPQGGSQAEALFLRGERCLLVDCDFYSYQDTMLLEGRVFADNLTVEGAVDYIWGTGTAFFRNCTLRSNADGYLVQARNAKGAYGYVFVGCKLTAPPGVARNYLARDGNGDFPNGDVRYIDCTMGSHVPAIGWLAATTAQGTPSYLEYRSVDPQGKLLATSGRAPCSRQLTVSEADVSRNPARVLGGSDGWDPLKALTVAATAPGVPTGKQGFLPSRNKSGRGTTLLWEGRDASGKSRRPVAPQD